MPNDTPLPRANPSRQRPSPTEQTEQSFPALALRDPRMRAALCYLFPLLPGLYTLWRERRNRFIRLHAAQSVIFFGALAVGQIALFLALAPLGYALAGGWIAVALGLLFWVAFIALGLGGLILWLRLLNDCAHGRLRSRPLLTGAAVWLEGATLRFTRSASAAYHERRNGIARGARAGADPRQ